MMAEEKRREEMKRGGNKEWVFGNRGSGSDWAKIADQRFSCYLYFPAANQSTIYSLLLFLSGDALLQNNSSYTAYSRNRTQWWWIPDYKQTIRWWWWCGDAICIKWLIRRKRSSSLNERTCFEATSMLSLSGSLFGAFMLWSVKFSLCCSWWLSPNLLIILIIVSNQHRYQMMEKIMIMNMMMMMMIKKKYIKTNMEERNEE